MIACLLVLAFVSSFLGHMDTVDCRRTILPHERQQCLEEARRTPAWVQQ